VRNEPDDEQLEDALRQLAARLEPVPPQLLQAAEDAFGWRDVNSELAELVFDSLLDTDDMALVRGSGAQRLVTFKSGQLTVDVEVTGSGSSRAVHGQIIPPRRAAVDIRSAQGSVTAEADESGYFQSAGLQPGPMSMRLSLADPPGQPVVTDWVSI
jgi:hypothetical protein